MPSRDHSESLESLRGCPLPPRVGQEELPLPLLSSARPHLLNYREKELCWHLSCDKTPGCKHMEPGREAALLIPLGTVFPCSSWPLHPRADLAELSTPRVDVVCSALWPRSSLSFEGSESWDCLLGKHHRYMGDGELWLIAWSCHKAWLLAPTCLVPVLALQRGHCGACPETLSRT